MDEVIIRDYTTNELKRQQNLRTGMFMADKFINKNYLISLSSNAVRPMEPADKSVGNIRLFRISKIVYDKKENVNDKLISVYSALQSVDSSVLMLLEGNEKETALYLGIRSDKNAAVAGKILESSFRGNFFGSTLSPLSATKIEQLMSGMTEAKMGTSKNVSSVTVVPSMRDQDKDKFVQGMEKFIDTMRGEIYTAFFIAKPVSKTELEIRKRGYEELHSSLSPFLKTSLSFAQNESDTVSFGQSQNFTESVNRSISNTTGRNTGKTVTDTRGSSFGFSQGGFNSGSNSTSSTGYTSGESWTHAVTEGTSTAKTTGTVKNDSHTTGTTKTISLEHHNKSVQAITEKLDMRMKRILECESFGVWECACYFISDSVQTSAMAASSFKALVSGDNTGIENSFVNLWGIDNPRNTETFLEYMKYGMHPMITIPGEGAFSSQIVTPANMISGKELPLLMGVPNKSVSGINVSTIAEFGRNVFIENKVAGGKSFKKEIHLGKIHHMGITEENDIYLDLNSLTSHTFVTGSTGSGKSNTTYCLLERMLENNIPFLVIEPAKGEYKTAFGKVPGINIFTTNPRYHKMLKINPFRFDENVHVLEHLDRLIEIFNACWEMYAAMPAILKEAVEKMYIVKGWDILNSIYVGEGEVQYPTFKDLMKTLPQVINTSSYSADTKGDYTGALVTRVASLTNGITGQIFCGDCDVSDWELFDENCIVDLSRVGSTETKSLIMGILVMKLTEYRSANATGQNLGLRHITVLEEAHNLLKNASSSGTGSSGGTNLIGKSVEMISNSIAEMRTYGEGFIIVDQSPTAVDISAIKNTNTKIIMRLPEQEDCKTAGSALSLNEEQILELSKLGTGIAIIMQNNWLEAVRGKIDRASEKYDQRSTSVAFEDLKQVRGVIIMELLNQFIARKMDEAKLVRAVQSLGIVQEKKEEYLESARVIVRAMAKNRNSKEFSDYMMTLAHCKNLFDILEPELASIDFSKLKEDDETQILIWQKQFLSKLNNYIVLNEGKKKILLKYLLYSKLREDGTSKYIKIYNVLYH